MVKNCSMLIYLFSSSWHMWQLHFQPPLTLGWSHMSGFFHYGRIRVFYHLPPQRTLFKQSLMDKRACVEVQKSSKEVPACHWSKKKKKIRDQMHWEGIVSLYLHHSSLKAAQLSDKRDILNTWFLSQGNMRVWVSTRLSKKTHFFLTPSRVVRCATQLKSRKQLGRGQTGLLEGIEGMQILWTLSRAPPGSSPMRQWGYLTCGSPQLTHGHHQHSMCLRILNKY